jgi:F-type H+-transporting ATPase subunit a
MRRLGCSIKILIPVIVIVLAMLIYGLVVGPLGSSILHIEPPEWLVIHPPHVQLAAEPVVDLDWFTITNTLIASWLTIIFLVLLFFFATRKMKLIPGRFQGFAEFVVESMLNFIKGVAGEKHARLLLPMVLTIFLYVMFNAYLGLTPIFGTIGYYEEGHIFVPFLRAANTDLNVPLSIALVAVIFVEVIGVRAVGGWHYIDGFFSFSKLGETFKTLFRGKIKAAMMDLLIGFIKLFIGFLEILSHFIRIISFTFRLFGNMTAGEILILVVTFLVPLILVIPFYGLELLVGFIQALIFAGLTLVFGVIALTPHSEE